MSNVFMINVVREVSIDRVRDLLCCALEGGSNYWYQIVEFQAPHDNSNIEFRHLDYPLREGGGLLICPNDQKMNVRKLDMSSIYSGLQLMAKDYPNAFNHFINENEDGAVGDVFLQCCLFQEVIYG